MQWSNQPIPLAPLYYTFWAGVLLALILLAIWLPILQQWPKTVTTVSLIAFILLVVWIWR